MKKIIILILISASLQAQTPIQSYNQQPIVIGPQHLGRDTLDNGYIVGRFAEFQTMILNSRTKEVVLQLRCYVRTQNDKPTGVRPVTLELRAGQNTYNIAATGDPIGDINDVLRLYGYRDTVIVGTDTTYGWKRDAQGRYLTRVAVIDGWSLYTNMMDNSDIRLRNIIRQTMIKPGNVAVIQRALKAEVTK